MPSAGEGGPRAATSPRRCITRGARADDLAEVADDTEDKSREPLRPLAPGDVVLVRRSHKQPAARDRLVGVVVLVCSNSDMVTVDVAYAQEGEPSLSGSSIVTRAAQHASIRGRCIRCSSAAVLRVDGADAPTALVLEGDVRDTYKRTVRQLVLAERFEALRHVAAMLPDGVPPPPPSPSTGFPETLRVCSVGEGSGVFAHVLRRLVLEHFKAITGSCRSLASPTFLLHVIEAEEMLPITKALLREHMPDVRATYAADVCSFRPEDTAWADVLNYTLPCGHMSFMGNRAGSHALLEFVESEGSLFLNPAGRRLLYALMHLGFHLHRNPEARVLFETSANASLAAVKCLQSTIRGVMPTACAAVLDCSLGCAMTGKRLFVTSRPLREWSGADAVAGLTWEERLSPSEHGQHYTCKAKCNRLVSGLFASSLQRPHKADAKRARSADLRVTVYDERIGAEVNRHMTPDELAALVDMPRYWFANLLLKRVGTAQALRRVLTGAVPLSVVRHVLHSLLPEFALEHDRPRLSGAASA